MTDAPGDFARDTAPEPVGGGRYRIRLSPAWQVWGPFGGYVAAIALRALAAGSALARPASFSCAYVATARFDEVTLEVECLRRGKRSEALAVRMRQGDTVVLSGFGWMVESGLPGFEHVDATLPAVPGPGGLPSYAERAADYEAWYPVWRILDGRPVEWEEPEAAGPAVWHTWMRLLATPPLDDPVLDAARSLMWCDLMMWGAAVRPHLPWPVSYLAPNLDLAAVFHARAADAEWLLCDAHAPVAGEGLVGCHGRLWTPNGRLVASATSTLLCRPSRQA